MAISENVEAAVESQSARCWLGLLAQEPWRGGSSGPRAWNVACFAFSGSSAECAGSFLKDAVAASQTLLRKRSRMGTNVEYVPQERVVLIVGNYGSGKTEVAVNLAIRLSGHQKVSIADLDIVNPYFRCREARNEMESFGIRVINPEGDYQAADLPIVLPEVRGAVLDEEGTLIFDVGGDDVGARVLSSLADVFAGRSCTMLQVLNAKRPFTETVEGCLKIKSEIEAASRLRITGLVSNTHLLEETDTSTVLEGLRLAREVARASGLPVSFVTANEDLRDGFDAENVGCPVLWIKRRMLPPWKLRSMTDRAERVLGRSPGLEKNRSGPT